MWKRFIKAKDGQVMVEYTITAVILTTMVLVIALLLYTFREQSYRVVELVASEYP